MQCSVITHQLSLLALRIGNCTPPGRPVCTAQHSFTGRFAPSTQLLPPPARIDAAYQWYRARDLPNCPVDYPAAHSSSPAGTRSQRYARLAAACTIAWFSSFCCVSSWAVSASRLCLVAWMSLWLLKSLLPLWGEASSLLSHEPMLLSHEPRHRMNLAAITRTVFPLCLSLG